MIHMQGVGLNESNMVYVQGVYLLYPYCTKQWKLLTKLAEIRKSWKIWSIGFRIV